MSKTINLYDGGTKCDVCGGESVVALCFPEIGINLCQEHLNELQAALDGRTRRCKTSDEMPELTAVVELASGNEVAKFKTLWVLDGEPDFSSLDTTVGEKTT